MAQQDHPQKGSNVTVDPIRDPEDIKRIKKNLSSHPRDYCLFVMGTNTGMRVGDILRLKVKDVKYKRVGEDVWFWESKSERRKNGKLVNRKKNSFAINKTISKALTLYFNDNDLPDDSPLFPSRKNPETSLGINHVSHLIKEWTFGIDGRFGCHSLRKTWGYISRVYHGVGWEIICDRYSHSHPAVTMRYLGITKKEVKKALMNEI
jgi:integrase